jgi:hypothetical protein
MDGSSRPDSPPPRTAIAALIFVLCCLLSSARLVIETPALNHLGSDHIAQRSDERFRALKAELPQRGVVGYIGETGNLAVGDYYLAQYALAPVVVDRSGNHPLVVGNFPAGSPPGDETLSLHVVKDFGGGVLLFSNPAFANPAFANPAFVNPAVMNKALVNKASANQGAR